MDEQKLLQILALVENAMKGDEQAILTILAVILAAQLGNQEAAQLAAVIQLIAESMLQLGLSLQPEPMPYAKNGAKLNYINYLRGKCPEGYEVVYFKKGGNLCKGCALKKRKMQDGASVPEPTDAVEAFKCGRQVQKKKPKKASCGKKLPLAKGGDELNTIVYQDIGLKQLNIGGEYRSIKGEAPGDTIHSYWESPTNRVVDYEDLQRGKQNWSKAEKGAKKGKTTVITPGDRLRKPSKKANGGSFIPFSNRVPR